MVVGIFVVIRSQIAFVEAVGEYPVDGDYGVVGGVLLDRILDAVNRDRAAGNRVGLAVDGHRPAVLDILRGAWEIEHKAEINPCAVADHMDVMAGLLGIGHGARGLVQCGLRQPVLHILRRRFGVEAPVADLAVADPHGHFGRFDEGVLVAADLVVAGNVRRGVSACHAYPDVAHEMDTSRTGRHGALEELTALAVEIVVDERLLVSDQHGRAPAKVDAFFCETHQMESLYVVVEVLFSADYACLGGGTGRRLARKVEAYADRHLGLVEAKLPHQLRRHAFQARVLKFPRRAAPEAAHQHQQKYV